MRERDRQTDSDFEGMAQDIKLLTGKFGGPNLTFGT